MITLITLIILLPLLNFLFGMSFGQFVGRGFYFISTTTIIVSFLISINCLLDNISTGNIHILFTVNLISSDLLHISWCFRINNYTVIALVIINFISSLAHMYSIEYMENDRHFTEYISYLSLLTFFAIMIFTSYHSFQIFLSFGGLRICNHFLSNLQYRNTNTSKDFMIAVLINCVQDFLMLLIIFPIFLFLNRLDDESIFFLALLYNFIIENPEILKLLYVIICTFIILIVIVNSFIKK